MCCLLHSNSCQENGKETKGKCTFYYPCPRSSLPWQPRASHITCRHLQVFCTLQHNHRYCALDSCCLWQLTKFKATVMAFRLPYLLFPLRMLNGVHAMQSDLGKGFTFMSALMEVQMSMPMTRKLLNKYISLVFLCPPTLELSQSHPVTIPCLYCSFPTHLLP